MAFQEVSSTGWFGRIGSSIKGILIGIILLIVAPVVLVMNERNAVKDIQANNDIARNVVSIGNDRVNSEHEGKLVHLNGPAETDEILINEKYGIKENAIRISWTAQIFQWVESSSTETRKKLGGGEERVTTYTYQKEWVDSPVDSSRFKEAGHENKGGPQQHQSGAIQSKKVNLGAFKLPSKLISKITSSQPYALAALPPALAGKGQVTDGVFHTGDLNAPQIGDEQVSFTLTPPQDVSVMAVQSDNTFTPYQTKSGKKKFLLYEGLLSAEDIVAGEEQKAKVLRWILRGAGVLVMFIGFTLILRPLSVLGDVIPFIGSLVGGASGILALLASLGISFLIIAISWVTFRPLVGIPLLILGVSCLALIIQRAVKANKKSRLAVGG